MKKSILLFALTTVMTFSGGYAQEGEETEKKIFSCLGTRHVGVSFYSCERSVTQVINGQKVTKSVACNVSAPACDKFSIKDVQFCLTKEECEEAKRKPNEFCESKRTVIVPQIPKSYSDLHGEVEGCLKVWEQTCRDYRLPGQRQTAGCVPTTKIRSDRPEAIGQGTGSQCTHDCSEE